MKIAAGEYSRLELAQRTGDPQAAGGVRAVVLDDGVERGIRALEFCTGGGLRFEVLVDRAMDIGVAEFDDYSFGWRSATGFRHPGLHENADEGGLAWLRSMSGLLVTGGLDHTLGPVEVEASNYHYPRRTTLRQGLHGRVANIPARLVGYGELWDGDKAVLWAESEVRQAGIFAEHLVEADITTTRWKSPSVELQGASHLCFDPPVAGFEEQVYEHVLAPGPTGRVTVRLLNERISRGFELEYDPSEFPSFFEWVNLRAGDYTVGLEPSTHHVEGEEAARKDGTLAYLEHGDSRCYHSTFRFMRW